MSSTPSPQQQQTAPVRVSPKLIGAGVLVMALGFGLPMLTPGTSAPRADTTTPEPATKPPAPAPIQPPNAPSLVGALLKLAVGMGVVCGLCVLVARLIGPKPPDAPGTMDVVASIAVAQCVLHLVRAGDRRLLIGTDLGGVKAVLELPGVPLELPPEPAAEPEAAVEPEPAPEPAAEPDPTKLTQEKLRDLLLRLRAQTAASPPG